MAALGRLLISLAAETAEFTAPLSKAAMHAQMQAEKMQKALAGAGKAIALSLGGIGAAASAGFLAGAKGQAAFLDAAQKAAAGVGLTTDAYVALNNQASLSGVSQTELGRALRRLSVDAASGGEKLSALGISVKDANGELKSSDTLLKEVSGKISQYGDGTSKTATAIRLFGDELGAKLVPLLNSSQSAFAETERRAIMFSGALDDDAATASANFSDRISELQQAGQGLMTRFLAKVMPMISELGQRIVDWVSDAGNFYNMLGKMNDGLRIVGVAAVLVGNAFGIMFDIARRTFDGVAGLISNTADTFKKITDLDFSGAIESAAAARRSITSNVGVIASDISARFSSMTSSIESVMSKDFVDMGVPVRKSAKSGIQLPIEEVLEDTKSSSGRKAREVVDRIASQIESKLSDIKKRLATFSLSDTEKELFDLKALGASPEQISRAEEGLKKLEAMAASKAAAEKAASDAADYRSKLEEEATRIIEDQKDAVQLLAEAEARLLEIQNAGLITSEQRQKEFDKMRARLDAELIAAQKHYDDMKSLAEGAAGDMEGALSDFLVKPSKDGFKDMLTSWADTLQQMVAKAAAAKIIDALGLGPNGDLVKTITGFLSGGSSSKSGGGLGDIFGSIGSAVTGFFGAPAGSKAGGGPVMHGRPYVVGENGPEIMIPGTSGAIVPNAALATLSGGKSVTTVNNISVSAPNGRLSRESIQQLQASLGRTMNRSLARNT